MHNYTAFIGSALQPRDLPPIRARAQALAQSAWPALRMSNVGYALMAPGYEEVVALTDDHALSVWTYNKRNDPQWLYVATFTQDAGIMRQTGEMHA